MEKDIRILFVDDDADDRKLFTETLKEIDASIECVCVNNGLDALQHLKNPVGLLPDFIFLDLRMPGLSGQECLQAIKKDARLLPIPVIVYTTSRDVKESVALKKMGAAHFMSKPVSPEEIYYMVSVVLGEKWV
jgi:CheY-like chemotaxis protein